MRLIYYLFKYRHKFTKNLEIKFEFLIILHDKIQKMKSARAHPFKFWQKATAPSPENAKERL